MSCLSKVFREEKTKKSTSCIPVFNFITNSKDSKRWQTQMRFDKTLSVAFWNCVVK